MAGSESFAPGVTEKLGFYVYLLADPRDGEIFYVGKGTSDRCFQHLKQARQTKATATAGFGRLDRIRGIEAAGHETRIEVLRHGLDAETAYAVEAAAIDLLKLADLTNVVTGTHSAEVGRMNVTDLNSLYGAKVVAIDPAHRVVLVRINRKFHHAMAPEELYEATRKWWVMGASRRDLGAPTAPDLAFSVYRGVVRAVYRIEGWHEADNEALSGDPTRADKWAFDGTPVKDSPYLHGNVTAYLVGSGGKNSTQNPLRFINCAKP